MSAQHTVYKGEYWLGHEVIKVFWEIFFEWDLEQRKKFLQFLMGSTRVPIQVGDSAYGRMCNGVDA